MFAYFLLFFCNYLRISWRFPGSPSTFSQYFRSKTYYFSIFFSISIVPIHTFLRGLHSFQSFEFSEASHSGENPIVFQFYNFKMASHMETNEWGPNHWKLLLCSREVSYERSRQVSGFIVLKEFTISKIFVLWWLIRFSFLHLFIRYLCWILQ